MQKNSLRKIAVGALTLAFAFGPVGLVLAEDNASTTGSTTVRRPGQVYKEQEREVRASTTAAIKNLKEDEKEKIGELRTAAKIEIKGRLDERRKNNVIRVITNRVREYTKNITKLLNRVTRVSNVAAKVKAAGKDTTVADAALADARAKLADGQVKLASISASATSTATSTTPGDKLNKLKDLFSGVNADIKTAHKDIATAISLLKGLGYGEHATSTNATTTRTTSTQ